jgi:hypothetical protein
MLKYQNYIKRTKELRESQYIFNYRSYNRIKADKYFHYAEAFKLCEYYSKAGEMYEKSSIYEDNEDIKFHCVREAIECYMLSYKNNCHKIEELNDIYLSYLNENQKNMTRLEIRNIIKKNVTKIIETSPNYIRDPNIK